MPSRGTRKHPIRVDDDLWEAYQRVCREDGTSCSEDLREHMRRRVADRDGEQPPEQAAAQ